MWETIKKWFNFFSAIPAFASLLSNAARTGKIDKIETLGAFSSASPSMQECANAAVATVKQGGGLSDVARVLSNAGDIDVGAITGNKGQTVNAKNVTRDLRNIGEPDSFSRKIGVGLANVFEQMPNKEPESVVEFGEAASDINNWQDIISK